MRLVSYDAGDGDGDGPQWRAGIVVGDRVVDAARAGAGLDTPAALATVRGLLTAGVDTTALAFAAERTEPVGALAELRIGPPVPDPDKILCIGLNYRAHAEETQLAPQAEPTVFAKFRNSLIGDGDEIVPPPATEQVDYEGELAVVIGRRTRRVHEADALAAVAGVMPLNDVSARDLQFRTTQWTAGKAVDTFAPCGPELVLMDEVRDIHDLRVMTRVNGEVVQDQRTSELIFDVAQIVAYLSTFLTLEPGDIVATGTPSGVGFTREPPLLLRVGDVVEVEIDGVGTLRNPVGSEAP